MVAPGASAVGYVEKTLGRLRAAIEAARSASSSRGPERRKVKLLHADLMPDLTGARGRAIGLLPDFSDPVRPQSCAWRSDFFPVLRRIQVEQALGVGPVEGLVPVTFRGL